MRTTSLPAAGVRLEQARTIGDPTVRFEDMIARVARSLDARTDDELVHDGQQLADSALREQALYQYLWRHGARALPVIAESLYNDTDTELRINLLWALEWIQ